MGAENARGLAAVDKAVCKLQAVVGIADATGPRKDPAKGPVEDVLQMLQPCTHKISHFWTTVPEVPEVSITLVLPPLLLHLPPAPPPPCASPLDPPLGPRLPYQASVHTRCTAAQNWHRPTPVICPYLSSAHTWHLPIHGWAPWGRHAPRRPSPARCHAPALHLLSSLRLLRRSDLGLQLRAVRSLLLLLHDLRMCHVTGSSDRTLTSRLSPAVLPLHPFRHAIYSQ